MKDLTFAFPHAKPTALNGMLADQDFDPHCGYISPQEAEILYNMACKYRGRWLEIGCHTGWSAAHIALSGNVVIALDPAFAGATRGRDQMVRTWENLKRAEVEERVLLWPDASGNYFAELPLGEEFAGVFIDGDHSAPAPLNDAINALAHIAKPGVIIFHDGYSEDIRVGVRACQQAGMVVTAYPTQQCITVCEYLEAH